MKKRPCFRYLSVTGNSVDAERSVSQYTIVTAPQRQNFTDENLALQVMMAVNARNWLQDFELVLRLFIAVFLPWFFCDSGNFFHKHAVTLAIFAVIIYCP